MPARATVAMIALVLTACTPGDCEKDGLICDALYMPLVTFTFTDTSTEESYCGPVEISYRSECDRTGEMSCDCDAGTMIESGSHFECHVNPPVGERSTITVSAPGYQAFAQDVRLPYECHPSARIDVTLEPL